MQIRVKVQDVSKADELKLEKILSLSEKRKKKYSIVENKEDILITSNPNYQQADNVSVLTLGDSVLFPMSKAHIKPPLLGIRVLKVLDNVEITQASISVESIPKQVANPDSAQEDAQLEYDILIVDDSVLIHRALELEINKAEFGANLTFVESGEQCLEAIKNKKIDLIFLDVMMPGIDGFETCTEIRKIPDYKKTPVIMLSAKTSPLDEVKGIMAGCTTYLTKPIKHEEFQNLLTRMDKWLMNFKPKKNS